MWHTAEVLFFARRNHRMIQVGAIPFGLNLHREGGVSLTGLPRSGGTTIAWGRMRDRCAASDAAQDTAEPVQLAPDLHVQKTRVWMLGPFMLRIGRNF